MFIGIMNRTIQLTGPIVKLIIHAKPLEHKTLITLAELEQLATHLAHEALTWRLDAQHQGAATIKPSTMKKELCQTTKRG